MEQRDEAVFSILRNLRYLKDEFVAAATAGNQYFSFGRTEECLRDAMGYCQSDIQQLDTKIVSLEGKSQSADVNDFTSAMGKVQTVFNAAVRNKDKKLSSKDLEAVNGSLDTCSAIVKNMNSTLTQIKAFRTERELRNQSIH